ncbi:MAG: hypothetical protein AAFV07_03270, partial [Bacteroidota bacterium]
LLRLGIFFLCFALFTACGGGGGEESADATTQEDTPEEIVKSGRQLRLEEIGLASPESVIGDGTHYYVSNVGPKLEPFEKDGDGFIMKLDAEGQVVAEKFIEGLDAPKGSAIVNGKFYVADIDKVKIFDLATGEAAGEIDFSGKGTSFLNDIAVKSNDEIFVSATDINRIYLIKLSDNSVEAIESTPNYQKPNGLWWDAEGNRLLVVGYPNEPTGVIGAISFKGADRIYTQLNAFAGLLDGVAIVGGLIFVTDWNRGAMLVLNEEAQQIGGFPLPKSPIEGPADFFFDAKKGEFWIPGMKESTISIQTL